MTQHWADACTQDCVWLFQVWYKGAFPKKDGAPIGWTTEAVFLNRLEAKRHGRAREYDWGRENKGWRIYGVPCRGEMAALLHAAGVNQEYIDRKVAEYREEEKRREDAVHSGPG